MRADFCQDTDRLIRPLEALPGVRIVRDVPVVAWGAIRLRAEIELELDPDQPQSDFLEQLVEVVELSTRRLGLCPSRDLAGRLERLARHATTIASAAHDARR